MQLCYILLSVLNLYITFYKIFEVQCVLYTQHILVSTSHIASAQWLHVSSNCY